MFALRKGFSYLSHVTALSTTTILFTLALNLILYQAALAASFTWSATGSLITGRYYHTATLLPNGQVLVAGGVDGSTGSNRLASAELYDPAAGTWSSTGSMATGRRLHTATLLPNGKVLVVGGGR